MQIEQLLPLDEVGEAVDAGRRRLGRIDLSGVPAALADIPTSTVAAARDTIPGPWTRPRPRWRWPLVGVLLVLGTAVLGFALLAPVRRQRAAARAPWDTTNDEAFGFATAVTPPPGGTAYLADGPSDLELTNP